MAAEEPNWFDFFGTAPPNKDDDGDRLDSGPGTILRRAIKKAHDDVEAEAAARSQLGLAASAGGKRGPVPKSGSASRSGTSSRDEDSVSSSQSSKETPVVIQIGAPKPASTVETMMLDTPANRKFLSGIAAKGDKDKAKAAKKTKSKADAFRKFLSSTGGGDPVPMPLRYKYDEIRSYYNPVTYPDIAEERTDDGSSDDTSSSAGEHKPECFLCAWGDAFHDGIEAPLIERFNGIFAVYYGTVDNAALAQMLHLYYMHNIYDRSRGLPELSQATALDHIEGLHVLDPRIVFGEVIRRYLRFLTCLEDSVFYTNNGFNRYAMGAYNNCVRMIMSLYKADVTHMNFYNAKLAIDLKRMGSLSQLAPAFTQKKKVRQPTRGMKRAREGAYDDSGRPADKRMRLEEGGAPAAMEVDALAPPDDQFLI